MDVQKASNWAQIIGTPIAAVLLGFTVWDHMPRSDQSATGGGWGGIMRGYLPPAAIAIILLASAVLQFIASRRKHGEPSDGNLLARFSGKPQQGKSLQERVAIVSADSVAERKRIESLEADLSHAKRDLAEAHKVIVEARKVINNERNQNEIHYKLWQDQKAKYENILWVVDIIGRQAKDLKRYVVIDLLSRVRVYLEDSTDGGPRIRCSFRIRNNSIFPDITIHRNEVKGRVSFRGKDLTERVKLDWHVRGVPMVDKLAYDHEGWIHLEQDLTSAETDRLAKALNSDDAIIGFEEIEIYISGGAQLPDIDRQTLVIPEGIRRVLLKECEINGNTEHP